MQRGRLPERSIMLLVSTRRGCQLVAACCTLAENHGVRVGMTLAHARSLLHGQRLCILNDSPDEDRQALERLAIWALRFTPIVAVDEPSGLLMDIAGCEHLYGGERPLALRISQALHRLKLEQRLAVGPTFSAARMAAQYAGDQVVFLGEETLPEIIAPFPVEALRIEPSVCESLYAIGVERIDQLLSLPRDALAARFGTGLLRRIDQALGTATELIQPVREPERYLVSYVFDGPVLNPAAIEVTAKQLLHTLAVRLKIAGFGASRLMIELLRIDAAPERIECSFTCPTNDDQHLWLLIHPKLERVNLGFGVEVITLHASRTARVEMVQTCLWPEFSNHATQNAGLGMLLDRLIERLGSNAVRHPVAVQSYIPERAFELAEFHQTDQKSTNNRAIYPADRPAHLFDVPEVVQVIALVPDGPPAQIRWRGTTFGVLASLAMERITGRWWLKTSDDQQPAIEARDYFAVKDEHGRWLWLFRLASSGQWFVHGEWA